MTTTPPDIFRNVHKGIRKALFDACTALGRVGNDEERGAVARALLRDALRFVSHHGENEDLLLVPLLDTSARAIAERMRAAHRRVDAVLKPLAAELHSAPSQELYDRTCELLALYLEHMREEERELEPGIRQALSVDQLTAFGRQCVERTSPPDQQMMLAWMIPTMAPEDAKQMLARLPSALAERLRSLAE